MVITGTVFIGDIRSERTVGILTAGNCLKIIFLPAPNASVKLLLPPQENSAAASRTGTCLGRRFAPALGIPTDGAYGLTAFPSFHPSALHEKVPAKYALQKLPPMI